MAIDFNAANKPRTLIVQEPELPALKAESFDLTTVRRALAVYETQIEAMVQEAEALEVKNDASNAAAVEMAGRAKKLNKAIEGGRTHFVEPHNEFVKAVNGLAKGYQARLGIIENGLKDKISQHQTRRELERRKAEEAQRKALVEVQTKLDAEAKQAGVESVKLVAPVAPRVETVTRTESATASQRKVWTFEVEDEAQVPRDYLMVDEKALRQAVASGVRQIPGVRIYQETKTQLRV